MYGPLPPGVLTVTVIVIPTFELIRSAWAELPIHALPAGCAGYWATVSVGVGWSAIRVFRKKCVAAVRPPCRLLNKVSISERVFRYREQATNLSGGANIR